MIYILVLITISHALNTLENLRRRARAAVGAVLRKEYKSSNTITNKNMLILQVVYWHLIQAYLKRQRKDLR